MNIVYMVIYNNYKSYGCALFVKGIYSDYDKAKSIYDELRSNDLDAWIRKIEIDHDYDTSFDPHYIWSHFDADGKNVSTENAMYIGGYIE